VLYYIIFYFRENRVSIYSFAKKEKSTLSDRDTLRYWDKQIAAESRPKFGYVDETAKTDQPNNNTTDNPMMSGSIPSTRATGTRRSSLQNRGRASVELRQEGSDPSTNEFYGYIPVWLGGKPFKSNPHFSKIEFYIRYILSIRSLIDIACILPSYIAFAGSSQGSTSFIRVLRILRIFKLITANKSIMRIIFIVNMSLQRSKDAFIILMMASFVVAIFSGSVMFTIEQGKYVVDSNNPTGYYEVPTINQAFTQQSLWQSAFIGAYYSAVTLTTGNLCYIYL